MKLVFATKNENKAREIRALLPAQIELITLNDLKIEQEIPETSPTIEGNARQKADYVTELTGLDCFADDTGLEVAVLNMEPGVRSARYAGEQRSDEDNMRLLLSKLQNYADRTARFKTVIALNLGQDQFLFEGIVNGRIILEKKGNHGFGYDPIFEPETCGRTFAEMTLSEKNKYSHRSRAFQKMIGFLKSQE